MEMRQAGMNGSTGTAQNPIRVLVTDNHPIFRRGIRCILEHTPDIELVGDAPNGMYAVALARRMLPDVAIVGINLSATPGLEVALAIRSQLPNTPIVLMTDVDRDCHRVQAVALDASALFCKNVSPQELLEGLRAVASGKSLMTQRPPWQHPAVLPKSGAYHPNVYPHAGEASSLSIPLAPRQIEVLEQIALGNSNKEIARALNISSQTVKHHITAIMRKLGAKDRTEAVVYALQHGWLRFDSTLFQ